MGWPMGSSVGLSMVNCWKPHGLPMEYPYFPLATGIPMEYPMGFSLGGILGLTHSFSRGTPWCTQGASNHRRSLDLDFGWYTFSPSFLDAVIPMSKNAIKCFAGQYCFLKSVRSFARTASFSPMRYVRARRGTRCRHRHAPPMHARPGPADPPSGYTELA